MLKDIIVPRGLLTKVKISIHLARSPLVCTKTKRYLCSENKPIKPKGSFISMFVHHAGIRMVSRTPTHRLNVARVQNTNSSGPVFTKGLRLSQVLGLNVVLKLRLLSQLSFVLKPYSQRVT